MKPEIDIVYPLGSGSRWQNNEIRYSLRSIEKYVEGVRNVYIIGQKPRFIGNVIHIPAEDPLDHNADGNIALKVLKACEQEDLSDTFLFINDDHIFIDHIHVMDIPYFYKFDLRSKSERYYNRGMYIQRLRRTRDILIERKLPTKHFDCHTPILFNKKLFPEIIERYPFRAGIGYTMKSLYANTLKIEGTHRPDLNIKQHLTFRTICDLTEDHTIMAFNDAGLNADLMTFLQRKFPHTSKYEIMDKDKQLIFTEAEEWLNAEDTTYSKARYDEGVRIHGEIGRNRHLQGMAKRNRTEKLMRAIERALESIVKELRKKGMKPLPAGYKKNGGDITVKQKKKNTSSNKRKLPVDRSELVSNDSGSRPKFDDNLYIDPNILPEHLLIRFQENKSLTKELGGLHLQLGNVPEGEEHNHERKQLADKVLEKEELRKRNWGMIDKWWKDQQNEPVSVSQPSGKFTLEQIEKMEDQGMKALCNELRIKANKRYIERYSDSEKPRQIEQIEIRRAELQTWGIEL